MTIERKTSANNNGYPATIYGTVESTEIGKLGSRVGGSGLQKEYTVEVEVRLGDDIAATEYGNKMLSRLPTGYKVESSIFYPAVTFGGALNVGVALEADGTGADADALVAIAAGATVGVPVAKTLAAPLDAVLVADHIHTIDTSGVTGAPVAGDTLGALQVKLVYAA